MRDVPTLNRTKNIRLKLHKDEYEAMIATIENNPELYSSKSEFVRKAVIEKMMELGTYVVNPNRPKVVRMDMSYRIKTFTNFMKKNPNEWMPTRDLIDHFGLDRSHVHRILNRMEKQTMISSRYEKKDNYKVKFWKWIKKRPLTSSQIELLRDLDENGNWQPASMFNRNTILSLIKRGNIEREGDFIRLRYKVIL